MFSEFESRQKFKGLSACPITEKESFDAVSDNGLIAFGVSAMQGWRRNMEDSHIGLLEFDGDPNAALFGIFDGHNGKEVAQYVAEHLPATLRAADGYASGSCAQALRQSLLDIDRAIFADWPDSVQKYADCSKRRRSILKGPCVAGAPGCAAVTCLIKGRQLHIANVGDCRIVLCRDGVAQQLSIDHKADLEGEIRRIEAAGGQIANGRVNGRLNMTRSIGDFAYKMDDSIPAESQVITAHADIFVQDLQEDDEFLILGCDGIWERRTSQEIVEFVKPRLHYCRQNGQTTSVVVEKLLSALISPDVQRTDGLGCDNMTCIIVDLKRSRRDQGELLGLPSSQPFKPQSPVLAHQSPSESLMEADLQAGASLRFVEKCAALSCLTLLGSLVGFAIGATLTIAGVFFFMMATCVVACRILVDVRRNAKTLHLRDCSLAALGWLLTVCTWLAVESSSAHLTDKVATRLLIFIVVGIVIGIVGYCLAVLYCLEDSRKHSLHACGPVDSSPATLSSLEIAVEALSNLQVLQTYARRWHDVFRARWWHDIVDYRSAPVDEESIEHDGMLGITVHNKTLKKIKVCLYASYDCLCWVPLGGVSGDLVGFVPAEQSRVFSLAAFQGERKHTYKLKVFQPGLLDIELACQANVPCGSAYVFQDAEQIVKRTLSRQHGVGALSKSQLTDSFHSEEEQEDLWMLGGRRGSDSVRSRQRSISGDYSSAKVPQSLVVPPRLPNSDEILLRNRSQQDIRAHLFSTNDYVNWIPLVGKIASCGDSILPDKDRWFTLKNVVAREFTLKIYDAGPNAKELTYLTVTKGQTYTFGNSLLS